MLPRLAAMLTLLLILAVFAAQSPSSNASQSDGADVASSGSFDKLTGTSKGTLHLSFPDYLQVYEGITTATITWEEDPDFFAEGCHCRAFFPTGTVDWSLRYEIEQCTDTDEGQIPAGTGPFQEEDQMLILWEDPADPTQYLYSGSGLVDITAFINCDGGFTYTLPDFFHIATPDRINTTTPSPLRLAPASGLQSCGSTFRVARDANRISGSCFEGETFNQYDYTKYEWDFKLAPEPIIFIHGFLGSTITCGGNEVWPGLPPASKLLDMKLASDGISPAPGACNASPDKLMETVLGCNHGFCVDVYKSTMDFLNQLSPGNAYAFPWDWRKGPDQSLAALDTFIAEKRALHDNSKVVIMAHSYGGLLARLYLNNSANAEKVARVLTVGTPAWGSPKALFPLYAGIESPDMSPLDPLMDNDDLKEFARNLTGDYYLYPSASYGPWLTVGGHPTPPLNRQGLLNYVTQLGGNATLLDQALTMHAGVLDTPYIGPSSGPKFEVIVGTGLPTIERIQVLPGGWLKIDYGNGDKTVPAKSAARGPLGSSNQNKDHTYYSCNVDHVSLPGKPVVTDAIDDFLKYGDDIEGLKNHCSFSAVQARLFRIPALPAGGGTVSVASADDYPSIEDAVLDGLVDYLDLPNEKFVIGSEFPEIALPPALFVEVTPLTEEGAGTPVIYGPLDGEVLISRDENGALVQLDSEPAPLAGDVDCNGAVNILDALTLLRHTSGTPQPQPTGCAAIGAGTNPHGDLDCDGAVTPADSLPALQITAAVAATALVNNCQ